MVQLGHFFERQWMSQANLVGRLKAEREEIAVKLKAAEGELGNYKEIAQDKENELTSARQAMKKLQDEVALLKGKNASLAAANENLEGRVKSSEEQLQLAYDRAEIVAKGRVYNKFLANTLSRETAERRLGYWRQFLESTGDELPDPTEITDTEDEEEELSQQPSVTEVVEASGARDETTSAVPEPGREDPTADASEDHAT